MASQTLSQRLVLEPDNPQRLANLCGRLNEHLKQIEQRLLVKIQNRGSEFMVTGEPVAVKNTSHILRNLYALTQAETDLVPDTIHMAIQEGINNQMTHEIPEAAPGKQDIPTEDNDSGEDFLLLRTPKA